MKARYSFLYFLFVTISVSFLLIFISGGFALAKVRIVTSVPDFAAIAKEIGGDRVEVKSIAKGYQDPHFVDAKPIFIRDLNRADLLIYQGLDMEVGWLPVLITGSRNSNITSISSPGHLDASTSISNILEVPTTRVDRSMGDIHPFGNPHYMLDPRNGILVARGILNRLIRIDPENSTFYEENYKDFSKKLSEKIKEWESVLAPYKGAEVVTYHKSWVYFTNWAGLVEFGYIEPKPGIPPSPSHVANLIKGMEHSGVKLVLAESYYPQKTARIIAEKTGSELIVLPSSVGAREGINTYTQLFDAIVNEVTGALNAMNRDQKDT